MSWMARLLGRRYHDLIYTDQPVRVRQATYHAGVLQAHMLQPSYLTSVTLMRSYWFMHVGGSSSAPKVLKQVEVCNPTAGALTFRMAIMATATGTPATSNAFLAWDYSLGAGEMWTWKGEVGLVGRYFYAKASGTGLTILVSSYTATP
jgi:hypothetical protein